jgi:N-dimethylarginine dimethylaminohydrolase
MSRWIRGALVAVIALSPAHTAAVLGGVWLERRADGVLHVYMPSFGVPLDDVAAQIWEEAGAAVHPIPVAEVFRLGGSVRCLSAPLWRGAGGG